MKQKRKCRALLALFKLKSPLLLIEDKKNCTGSVHLPPTPEHSSLLHVYKVRQNLGPVPGQDIVSILSVRKDSYENNPEKSVTGLQEAHCQKIWINSYFNLYWGKIHQWSQLQASCSRAPTHFMRAIKLSERIDFQCVWKL